MSALTVLNRSLLALALAGALAAPAQAQHAGHDHGAATAPADAKPAAKQPAAEASATDHSTMDHSQMDHGAPAQSQAAPASVDHSGMDHSRMGHGQPAQPQADHSKKDHSRMDHSQMDHSQMDHGAPAQSQAAPASVDHSGMDHSRMGHGQPAQPQADHSKMDHSKMDHSQMGHGAAAAPSQPREPIPAVTQADRAAAFPPLKHHMEHAPAINHYVVFNRLEAVDADEGSAQAWEGQAWIGNDTDRLWLRTEGEREQGRTESAQLEALYGRAISPWWDFVVGARHDFRPGPSSQTWAAIGVQGLSPYKFEVSATAYLGESGRTAAAIEAEYELLLTNRLILQPLVELEFNGKDDPARGVGAGLSTAEAGLRLRYEITRQFAPYIGVSWERSFGDTADYRRAHGERAEDTRLVAGVRVWF